METKETSAGRDPLIRRLVVAAVLLAAPAIVLALASRQCVIEYRDGDFRKARIAAVAGPLVIGMAGDTVYRDLQGARAGEDEGYSLLVSTVARVAAIHYHDVTAPPDGQDIPPGYLGTWQITAAGHRGILVIYMKDNTIRGTVRFTDWGNRAVEYLGGVAIAGNSIRFVRAVTTAAEMKRVGASSYFTQVYRGTFGPGGRTIKGFYETRGTKNIWEAVRGK